MGREREREREGWRWNPVLTADGGGAGCTLLGVQVAEAVEAVGKVVSRGETLA